jgi:hypothetical protein
MVGAGIFSLLGPTGEVAGAAVSVSFLIAGVIAGLQGYSFAKFGARYRDRNVGGPRFQRCDRPDLETAPSQDRGAAWSLNLALG